MIQKFIEENYEIVDFEDKADIYIINTCTVTNMSDKKSRQIIRRAKHKNKNAILVVVGCYAQVAKDKLEKIEEVDIVLGNNEKSNIVKCIEQYEKTLVTDVMQQKEFVEFGCTTYTDKTRAVIKVQDGCDRFCSYCIIPYARGRVRSRKIENIVEEISQIAANGIKEVVITGIHIASFGRDFKDGTSLIDLLEAINKIDGIERIRLGSLEPTIITEEFLTRLTKLEKICDHFHLSLQSGCDETLKRMNRKYTTQEFEHIVNLLRNAYPEVALTTDIIVGFPGETEKEFKSTYNFLSKIKFMKMHIFKYSQRNGTKAAIMENQIDGNKKEERSNILIELSDKNEKEFMENYIGKEVPVLFEQIIGENIEGHTKNYITVKVPKNEVVDNEIKTVKINKFENLALIGEII